MEERFTVVFEGDIKSLNENPFKMTKTPFGVPHAIAQGDQLALMDEAREWLEACLGMVEGHGPPNWDGIREFLGRS